MTSDNGLGEGWGSPRDDGPWTRKDTVGLIVVLLIGFIFWVKVIQTLKSHFD